MDSEEELVIKIGNYHRDAIRKFIPWFGETEGEVIKELALRWIEANIANPNIIRIVEANEVHICKARGCPHDSTTSPKPVLSQENRGESPAERKGEGRAPIPRVPSDLIIPKFAWDKTKEKSYGSLFFFEAEDGRVMLSYSSCRVFTTKAAVMQILFPVPNGYAPLKDMVTSKRTAIRVYRKYLAGLDAGYLGEYETSERDEKLMEAARINTKRWKPKDEGDSDTLKKEMGQRTKELHDNIVMKIKMGVGADVSG